MSSIYCLMAKQICHSFFCYCCCFHIFLRISLLLFTFNEQSQFIGWESTKREHARQILCIEYEHEKLWRVAHKSRRWKCKMPFFSVAIRVFVIYFLLFLFLLLRKLIQLSFSTFIFTFCHPLRPASSYAINFFLENNFFTVDSQAKYC